MGDEQGSTGPPRKLLAVVALVLAAAGVGSYWLWPPLSVIVSFVATLLALGVVMSFNFPTTRVAFAGAGLLHAASVYLTTRSVLLTLAASLVATTAPTEVMVRWLGDRAGWQVPLVLLVALGLAAASWPLGLHSWPVAPAIALLAFISFMSTQPIRALPQYKALPFKAKIGQPIGDIRLAGSDGAEPWDIADERGRYVLLAFLRGHWCPLCHVQMRVYQLEKALLEERGVKLVVITFGFPLAHRQEAGLDYLLLEDPESVLAERLGIIDPVEQHEGDNYAVPVSILVDGEGIVRYAPTADAFETYVDPRRIIEVIDGIEPRPT